MATQDFTEHPVADRETATRLNPFIGYGATGETLENVRMGLEFLSLAAYSLADGNSDEAMGGLSTIFGAMGAALSYERETARGAL